MRNVVLVIAVSSVAFGAGYARAGCADPRATCAMMEACIYDGEPRRVDDRARIRQGVETGNGNLVWQGLDACQVDKNQKDGFDKASGGCSDADYLDLAKRVIMDQNACNSLPKKAVWQCVQNTAHGQRILGEIVPGGACQITTYPLCSCVGAYGQVSLIYK